MNLKSSWLMILLCLVLACHVEPVSEFQPQPTASELIPKSSVQPSPSTTVSNLPVQTKPTPSPTPLDVFAVMQDFYLAQSQNYSNCRKEQVVVPRDVEVRKSFLPTQTLQAGQEEFAFDLNLNSGADLKRRMLFNLRHGEIPVDSVHVRVNGTELKTFFPDDSALISEAPDMVWDLCSYLHEGQNRLSIAVSGEASSSVEIFVDGFIMPVDIPEAFHSVGGLHSARDAASPLLTVKFIEEMLFLLNSYYLVKPLRSSYYLKEFSPTWLPYFFVALPILSLLVTRLFNYFYGRFSHFRLIWLTYAVVIACKLFFLLTLPHGGKVVTLLFYFWASVYFLLSISILWACLSTIFNSEAGERCFAFIAFGGMGGALMGSRLSEALAHSAFKDQALLCSALCMGLVLAFLAVAVQQSQGLEQLNQVDHSEQDGDAAYEAPKRRFWQDLASIWQHKYMRTIATMVFALAFMNTVVEFKSQKVIDRQLARQQYAQDFAALNQELCATQAKACSPTGPAQTAWHAEAFETVYTLKQWPADQRQKRFSTWLQQHAPQTDSAQAYAAYLRYHDSLESQTRALFSRINFWINLLGMVLLLLAARPLFRYVGVQRIILVLPLCFLGVGALLLFPMELALMTGILIGTGTLNYSLNKTAKELLYTQGDQALRFKFKPLIEGPVMRFGDVSAALFKILCLNVLHLPERQADWALLGLGLVVTALWLRAMWDGGRIYRERKSSEADSNFGSNATSSNKRIR